MPCATVDLSNLQLSFSENGPAELMTDNIENTTQVLTPVDQQDAAASQSARWSKPEVLCLLQLYKENVLSFADPKTKKNAIWDKISKQMNSMGYSFSGTKCETKIKNLNRLLQKQLTIIISQGKIGKHVPTMMSSVIFLGCPHLLDPYHCAQAGMALLVNAEVHLSDDSFADPPTSSSESANSPASDAQNIDGAERKGKKPTARKSQKLQAPLKAMIWLMCSMVTGKREKQKKLTNKLNLHI